MTCLLSGIDLTVNLGMLSRCSAASYEQMILDHELCLFLQRFGKGVAVGDDTLGLNVMREVGIGGNFLLHEHTARHCRSGEIWYPRILDRSSVGAERKGILDRAHQEVERMLAAHMNTVDDGIQEELMSYVEGLS